MTLAVVGLGYGRAHAESVDAIEARRPGTVRLAAVADLLEPATIERVQRSSARQLIMSAPSYHSLSDLLAHERPDVVVIATPLHTHRDLALEALAAGCHLLLEKPPTATMADLEVILSAAQAAGLAVQVGLKARGGGALRTARTRIADGELGQVHHVGAYAAWHRGAHYFTRWPWAGHRVLDGRPVLDGAVTNALSHAVDAALFLAGAGAAQDIAQIELDWWHANRIEADDTTSIRVRLHGERPEVVAGLTIAAPANERSAHESTVTAWGSEGAFEVHYLTDELVRLDPRGRVVERAHLGRTDLLENLVDHLLGGVRLLAPLSSTGPYVEVLEHGLRSSAPRQIPERYLSERDGGVVLDGAADWCGKVAREGLVFTELGAPWTR